MYYKFIKYLLINTVNLISFNIIRIFNLITIITYQLFILICDNNMKWN